METFIGGIMGINMKFCEKASNNLAKLILREQVKAPKAFWVGSGYGGFYVVPLKGLRDGTVFSFGIGEDISFDKGLMELFGKLKVYGFDPTPKSCKWVEANCKDLKNFTFFPYGISVHDGMQSFYLPKNPKDVSGSLVKNPNTRRKIEVSFKNIKSIMNEIGIKKVDILKLDIEGSEIEVIPDILKSGFQFRQLCVEVHYRFWKDHRFYKLYKFRKILNDNGYFIAALSQSCEEVTFVRRDRT